MLEQAVINQDYCSGGLLLFPDGGPYFDVVLIDGLCYYVSNDMAKMYFMMCRCVVVVSSCPDLNQTLS